MKRLESAYIVKVFGVVTSVPRKLILVMELMPGGDLFLYIRKKRQENQTIPEKVRLGNSTRALGTSVAVPATSLVLGVDCIDRPCCGSPSPNPADAKWPMRLPRLLEGGGGGRASLYVSVLTRESVGVGLAVPQYYL